MTRAEQPKVSRKVYFTEPVDDDIASESRRLDRSSSYLIELAWKIARAQIRRLQGTPPPGAKP